MKTKILSSSVGYDLAAQSYDKKQAYLDSFEQDRLLSLLGDINGLDVLDVGAGTGRLALRMEKMGARVTALDVSVAMLKELDKKSGGHIKTVIGDAEVLDFAADSFDIVVATFLLVHLKDPRYFFTQAYRVLKDGGKLLVTNINQKRPPSIRVKNQEIKIESFYHRPEKITELLLETGFGITKEVFVKEDDVWINQMILAEK